MPRSPSCPHCGRDLDSDELDREHCDNCNRDFDREYAEKGRERPAFGEEGWTP